MYSHNGVNKKCFIIAQKFMFKSHKKALLLSNVYFNASHVRKVIKLIITLLIIFSHYCEMKWK